MISISRTSANMSVRMGPAERRLIGRAGGRFPRCLARVSRTSVVGEMSALVRTLRARGVQLPRRQGSIDASLASPDESSH